MQRILVHRAERSALTCPNRALLVGEHSRSFPRLAIAPVGSKNRLLLNALPSRPYQLQHPPPRRHRAKLKSLRWTVPRLGTSQFERKEIRHLLEEPFCQVDLPTWLKYPPGSRPESPRSLPFSFFPRRAKGFSVWFAASQGCVFFPAFAWLLGWPLTCSLTVRSFRLCLPLKTPSPGEVHLTDI